MPKAKTLRRISLAGSARDKVRPGHADATPERLEQARVHGAAAIDGQGVRRIADPFDVLRSRHLLDRTDPALNELLWQAGDRLRSHWHRTLLDGLATLDPARPSVDGGGGAAGALNPTEAALRHREHWHRAAECVGRRLFPYLEAVVVRAVPISALRGLVGDTAHARTADALVLERLREGLHRLTDLWSMHQHGRSLPVRSWHHEPASDPKPPAPQD